MPDRTTNLKKISLQQEKFTAEPPVSDTHASRWLEQWAGKVRTPGEMVRFVNAVGCCTSKELPAYPGLPCQDAVMGEIDPEVPDPWVLEGRSAYREADLLHARLWWSHRIHILQRATYPDGDERHGSR